MLQKEIKSLLTSGPVFVSYRHRDRSLLTAIENKLSETAARVKSTEFNRQCLLATHSVRRFYREAAAYVQVAPFSSLIVPIRRLDTHTRFMWGDVNTSFSRDRIFFGTIESRPKLVSIFQAVAWDRQIEYRNERLGFFHKVSRLIRNALVDYFSALIDKVADYWLQVVNAWETFKSFSIGTKLRQRIKTALKFKPLHTPVRIVPQSIHPIESAI